MNPILEMDVVSNMDGFAAAIEQVDRFIEDHGMAPPLDFAVRLAFEELVTNVIKYGYDAPGDHRIRVRLDARPPVTLTIDDGGRPFNPLADAPPPRLDGPMEERPIGGLGLHMIRSMGISLDYRRERERNILRLVFPAEPGGK